jgi:hypothetical protein
MGKADEREAHPRALTETEKSYQLSREAALVRWSEVRAIVRAAKPAPLPKRAMSKHARERRLPLDTNGGRKP